MKRTRVQPKRLQNEQAKNIEEAAARAASRSKRKRITQQKRNNTPSNTGTNPKRRKTPSNTGTNPKSKLLNTLAKLRNAEAPRNGLNRY